ncbi:unnamed protein product, partial [Prorocentrum cordatum]
CKPHGLRIRRTMRAISSFPGSFGSLSPHRESAANFSSGVLVLVPAFRSIQHHKSDNSTKAPSGTAAPVGESLPSAVPPRPRAPARFASRLRFLLPALSPACCARRSRRAPRAGRGQPVPREAGPGGAGPHGRAGIGAERPRSQHGMDEVAAAWCQEPAALSDSLIRGLSSPASLRHVCLSLRRSEARRLPGGACCLCGRSGPGRCAVEAAGRPCALLSHCGACGRCNRSRAAAAAAAPCAGALAACRRRRV